MNKLFPIVLALLFFSSFMMLSSCNSIDLSFFNYDATPWDSPEGQLEKSTFINSCNKNIDNITFFPKSAKSSYCDCMFQKIVLKYPSIESFRRSYWEYYRKWGNPFKSKAQRECGVWHPPVDPFFGVPVDRSKKPHE